MAPLMMPVLPELDVVESLWFSGVAPPGVVLACADPAAWLSSWLAKSAALPSAGAGEMLLPADGVDGFGALVAAGGFELAGVEPAGAFGSPPCAIAPLMMPPLAFAIFRSFGECYFEGGAASTGHASLKVLASLAWRSAASATARYRPWQSVSTVARVVVD